MTPTQKARQKYSRTAKGKFANRKSQLMYHYKITPEELAELQGKHKGCCGICGRSFYEPSYMKHTEPHIDHDHATGKVRELLCAKCNHLLGDCYESVAILRGAITYLEEYKGEFH